MAHLRPRPIHFLALLLALQALFLAFFVTPLGDIPDESGHYAYVIDMTKGRPLPVLGKPEHGKGEIPADLWKDYEGLVERHRVNYIVQHPPLYYAVAAIPYALTKSVTQDKATLARSARVVSALSLGLLILVVFKTLLALRIEERLALAMASWFAFIPMVSHLSSGISNDIFLTLTCALGTLYLARFVTGQRITDAYLCALWLTLAGATKMTSWLLIAGFLGILLYEMRQPLWRWIVHAAGLSVLAFAAPVWWMRRNIYHFNDPLFVYGSHLTPKAPDYSLFEYFTQQPFFDWLFTHFYALVGFSGYCLSAPSLDVINRFCKGAQLTTVEGPSMRVFTAVSVVCMALLAWALVKALNHKTNEVNNPFAASASIQSALSSWLERPYVRRLLGWSIPLVGMVLFALSIAYSQKLSWYASGLRQTAEFGMLFCTVVGLGVVLLNRSASDRMLAYGCVLLTLFTIMVFLKGHEAFQLTGHPNGIQGRYLYPFVPLALGSLAIALSRLRHGLTLALAITVALCWAHLNAYLGTILPFYEWVAL